MPKATQLHVTLSDKSKEYLYQIRDTNGLGSISGAINWLIATDRLAVFLKRNLQVDHKIYTAGRRKPTEIHEITKMGKCQIGFCKYEGTVTKSLYKEWANGELVELELFMCPKHIEDQSRKDEYAT